MPRYIDTEGFDRKIKIAVGFTEEELTFDFKDGIITVLKMLKEYPTADVVEVVRCEDCIWWDSTWLGTCAINDGVRIPREAYDFCSKGERKEENG